MSVNLGDRITKKLATGRVYTQLTGDAFYRDLGNVVEHKYDPSVTRKEHMRSSGGLRRTDMSLAATISPKYTWVLDEHTPDLEQLRLVGTQGNDAAQGGGVIAGEVLTASSKQGRTYFAANLSLSAYTVKVGGVAKVENVDYVIDVGSGAVTILNGGGIADTSNVTIDYTAAAVNQHVFTAYKSLFVQGLVKFVEYDQFSSVPRLIHTFNGQLYVSNWGDNKDDYNLVTLEAIPLDNPIVKTRVD